MCMNNCVSQCAMNCIDVTVLKHRMDTACCEKGFKMFPKHFPREISNRSLVVTNWE